MNRDKNVWNCPGCAEGGDLWDIAAWRFGYPVPGYKTDKKVFRKLRDDICLDLGFTIQTSGGAKTYIPPGKPEEPVKPEELATVTTLRVVQNEEDTPDEVIKTAGIDWRQIVEPDTFLAEWMDSTTKDTCPEEFHLFTGLMALSFAVGRNRTLRDEPEVVPNLYVCLVGKSGTGKSRAKRHLKTVLFDALPFDEKDPFPTGTKVVGTPGSGEAIVKEMNHEIEDPSNPNSRKLWPLRGYVEFDEMATLIAKGQRMGSSLKQILMELYDAPQSVSNVTVTGGRVYAREPYTGVMTTTQNKSIRGVLNEKDDAAGFINRWVFVTGPPKQQMAINTKVVDLKRAGEMLRAVHAWAVNKVQITFTDSAMQKFSEFIMNRVFPAKDKSEENTDIFNRMDLLLKKILVILCCNEKKNVVDDGIVDKMITLYPYLTEVYGVVDVEMAKTLAGELAETIVNIINKYYDRNKKFPTAREILNRINIKKRNTDELNKALRTMVELGLVTKNEVKADKGPAAMRYGVPA